MLSNQKFGDRVLFCVIRSWISFLALVASACVVLYQLVAFRADFGSLVGVLGSIVLTLLFWKQDDESAIVDLRKREIRILSVDKRSYVWPLDELRDVEVESDPKYPRYKRLRLLFEGKSVPLTTAFFSSILGDSGLKEAELVLKSVIKGTYVTFDESLEEIEGFSTHILLFRPGGGLVLKCTSQILVVVPGNPGVAAFYTQFASELALKSGKFVVVIGHSGHSGNAGVRYVGLHEQAQHKISVIKALQKRLGFEEVVLIGHSIGCYLLLDLGVKNPEFVVSSFLFLCPTFCHLYKGFSPVVKIAVIPVAREIAANMLHYCPISVRNALIWLFGHDTDEVKLVVTDHLDYFVVRNILKMALQEGEEVLDWRKDHLDYVRANKKKMVFAYSQIDHYTPLSYLDEMKNLVGAADLDYSILPKDVEHAFVLGHSVQMAGFVVDKLSRFKY